MKSLDRGASSRRDDRDDLPLLHKMEAPVEYLGVGSSLSPHRRESAESGSVRQIVRKLSILFDAVAPPASKLVATYGRRASEILQNRHVNPVGTSQSHGPFATFVGADAASLWAAATSGGMSVSLHLLACLLARAFSNPTHSVSVWAEIVLKRQEEFSEPLQGLDCNIDGTSPPISQEEIREWDASARAWLQTADSAMQKNHIKLKLALKDFGLPVHASDDLYTDVIQSWTSAMLGLEQLLDGRPHTIADSATLLAISAWHLYPDLLVLGTQIKNVEFTDYVIPSSGLLTVDTTVAQDNTAIRRPLAVAEGIYWPALLSKLELDGSPINVLGTIDYRIGMDELYLIALGSLLRTWDAPQSEIKSSLPWFIALWASVSSVREPLPKPRWIENLAEAATRLLEASGETETEYQYLVDFGYRQGRNFLVSSHQQEDCLPWFGLRHWHVAASLGGKTPGDCGVRYLRQLAKVMGLKFDEAIITQISHENISTEKQEFHQYTTALRVPLKQHEIPLESDDDVSDDASGEEDGAVPGLIPDEGPIRADRKGKKKIAPENRPRHHKHWQGTFTIHDDYIPSKPIDDRGKIDKDRFLQNPLSMAEQLVFPLQCYRVSDRVEGSSLASCQASIRGTLDVFPTSPVNFVKVVGDSTGALRLWITSQAAASPDELEGAVRGLQMGKGESLIHLDSSIDMLTSGKVCPESLWQYLEGPDPYEPDAFIKPFLELCRRERQQSEPIITSLRSLVVAQSIYRQLDGATISSTIVKQGIYNAEWAQNYHLVGSLTRSVVFGCIAMLDTGKLNFDTEKLEKVFGLSSGNSLFVASRLLADPSVDIPEHAVSRIVGNIGHQGVSLLIPPITGPQTRLPVGSDNVLSYKPFNGRREDSFNGTTLHLQITSQDHHQLFIESIISVYDTGKWVADLDISRVLNWEASQQSVSVSRVECSLHSAESRAKTLQKFVAVDSWGQVFGNPPAVGLVRAYKNWPARVAASVISMQKGDLVETDTEAYGVVPSVAVLDHGDDPCWTCVYKRLSRRVHINRGAPIFLVA